MVQEELSVKRILEQAEPESPFGRHGALAVRGTRLVDAHGAPVQLRGVSTHGITVYPDYVNEAAFAQFRGWGASLVRLALYTEEENGYETGGEKEALCAVIDRGVRAAAALGLYALIDWHILQDGNPLWHLEDAKSFFSRMAQRYGACGHVLYEICNEPNGPVSWAEIKEYAKEVLPCIRRFAPDAVVLVGTPSWSQDVDRSAEEPLEPPLARNTMYTLHFYADTHRDALREKARAAWKAGAPLFVSEYGICDASGNGSNNLQQGEEWLHFLDAQGISYAQWNLSNKAESSAFFRPDC